MARRASLRAPRGVRRFVDAALFCAIAATALLFCFRGGEAVASPWDMPALIRAFFRMSEDGLAVGPLGKGLINTLRVAFWSMPLATLIGFALGLARSARVRPPRMAGACLVALLRNLPPLALIFVMHYFLSGALAGAVDWSWTDKTVGLRFLMPEPSAMPVFVSAVLTLSLYEGAYVGEIVRAGLASVPVGQWEAAASLGLSRGTALARVILPQAARFMLPPLTAQAASLIKDSAIVSVISVQELTFQGTEYMTSSGLAGEVWVGVTLCYLLLCLAVSLVGRGLEARRKWA